LSAASYLQQSNQALFGLTGLHYHSMTS